MTAIWKQHGNGLRLDWNIRQNLHYTPAIDVSLQRRAQPLYHPDPRQCAVEQSLGIVDDDAAAHLYANHFTVGPESPRHDLAALLNHEVDCQVRLQIIQRAG
ncbi:hypothetical protein D3C80_892750 [compost metagenome]